MSTTEAKIGVESASNPLQALFGGLDGLGNVSQDECFFEAVASPLGNLAGSVAELLTSCPVCQGDLIAVRLECDGCGTGIDGRFEAAGLSGLSHEQMKFVEVFMHNRGIIRDVESELGVSYPKVRSMLDDVVESMERAATAPESPADAKGKILLSLQRGDIDVDAALRALSGE